MEAVDSMRLTTGEKEALVALLDDPSPSVRQALLAEFARLGSEGNRFLR